MNTYFKNYGIWLGGLLLVSFLIPFTGNYLPFTNWIAIIAGTIIGTVMTHKELNGPINFGKAAGAVCLFIGGFFILGILINIVRWGVGDIGYFLSFYLYNLILELVVGISILLAAGTWYMFEKAGKPGWAFIVPIYNLIVMCEIAKKPTWWVVMIILVPIANIVFLIMMLDGIAKNFGKDTGFTIGLIFLRQIFFAILGYGDAQYTGGLTNVQNEELIDTPVGA